MLALVAHAEQQMWIVHGRVREAWSLHGSAVSRVADEPLQVVHSREGVRCCSVHDSRHPATDLRGSFLLRPKRWTPSASILDRAPQAR